MSHSMVRLGKGLVILGGVSLGGHHQAKIYSMVFSNRNCNILLLNRKLSGPKSGFVAIPIPDTISGCITGGKKYFQKSPKRRICTPTVYTTTKLLIHPSNIHSMPVCNTDWGWFLPGL